MFKFDVYSFYAHGYTTGFLPRDIVDLCRQVIDETPWCDAPFHITYPEWSMLPDDGPGHYKEVVRNLKSLNSAPPKLKYIGESILALPYFDDLKKALIRRQHGNATWIKTFVPNGYGLWNRQVTLPWHSDINDGTGIAILAYFTKNGQDWNREWDGQLLVGVEDAQGNVNQVYEHYPVDGTFVAINNTNPLFKHSVIKSADGVDRYTMSFRYSIK